MLLVFSILLPSLLLILAETSCRIGKVHAAAAPRRRGLAIVLAVFFTALGVSEFTTQCIKLVVRRRRPNFYALCAFVKNACTASNPQRIIEAQLSFPSGHSSLSMCAAVILWHYFRERHLAVVQPQYNMRNDRRFLLQLEPWCAALSTIGTIGVSIAIGITRLVDHWHHPSDVLAGWLLGAAVATGVWYQTASSSLSLVTVSSATAAIPVQQTRGGSSGEKVGLV